MFSEPADLQRGDVVGVLADVWGIEVDQLEYRAVGFGSHHYEVRDCVGSRWFVNVDVLDEKAPTAAKGSIHLATALRTVAALSAAGLTCVHAPIEGIDGAVLAPVADTYGVSVFEFLDGRTPGWGGFTSEAERAEVLACIGTIHAATPRISATLPPAETFELRHRASFIEALADVDRPWSSGPYSERARLCLGSNVDYVSGLARRYDELVGLARALDEPRVITHGEPHSGNIMRLRDGSLRLIDWDTLKLAPRERDLWMLEPLDAAALDAYAETSGVKAFNPHLIELYRLWWALDEITGCTRALRSAHEDNEDMRETLKNFTQYLVGSP